MAFEKIINIILILVKIFKLNNFYCAENYDKKFLNAKFS